MICEYGCGKEATHQFKNGKWCCSKSHNICPKLREEKRKRNIGIGNPRYGKKLSQRTRNQISNTLTGQMVGEKNPFFGKRHSKETKKIQSLKKIGHKLSKETVQKMIKGRKLTISKIKSKYPFFSKIEDMRYNPDKPSEKEIQVHCKNHNCKNSKEQGGWFTPSRNQLTDRRRSLESIDGMGGHYLYCSQKCKDTCPLYNIYSDPFKNTDKSYTLSEYQQFREVVLERDRYICQYCGEPAVDVHHERPQKLEPFFALDPDYAWSVCKKCHYEKGHINECSTGKLASKVCL